MICCIDSHCADPRNPEGELFCQACGSELLLNGRYRAIRHLGGGGFGKTFEVHDHDGCPWVLKVLILAEPKAVSLFQQEARLLAALDHPGIPRVHPDSSFVHHCKSGTVHCLVMEQVQGLDLQKYMERRDFRPLGEELAHRWLRELLKILQEVHNKGILHRDIKPANVMLGASGQLKLIDFGTARVMSQTYLEKHAEARLTSITSAGYTPAEQSNGQPVPQSDLFALGRTMVFLLTGKTPVELYDAMSGEFPWRLSAPEVSEGFARLLDRMMAPLASDRPGSASEILLGMVPGAPVPVEPQPGKDDTLESESVKGREDTEVLPKEVEGDLKRTRIGAWLTEATQKMKENHWSMARRPPITLVNVDPAHEQAQILLSKTQAEEKSKEKGKAPGIFTWIVLGIASFLMGAGIWNWTSGEFNCLVAPETRSRLIVDGSTTMVAVNKALTANYEQKCFIGAKYDYSGSEEGIKRLKEGKVDIAAVSHSLGKKELEEGLDVTAIADDNVAIVVKPKVMKYAEIHKTLLYTKGLTVAQLRDIFSGRVVLWSEVGGPDAPIETYSRKDNSGTLKFFREKVMGGDALRGTHVVDETTALFNVMSPDGIGFATSTQSRTQTQLREVKVDGVSPAENSCDYPLRRKIYYAYRKPVTPEVKNFIDYALSKDGQAVVEEVKFYPPRSC